VAVSEGFAAYALELLAPLGGVKAKRFFGGYGFFIDGLMFAFVSRDVLYLKSDAETQPRLQAAGAQPFIYEAKNAKRVSVNYYSMPDEAMESPALALPWARMAVEASLRKANAKAPAKPVRKKTAAVKKPVKKAAKKTAKKAANKKPARRTQAAAPRSAKRARRGSLT